MNAAAAETHQRISLKELVQLLEKENLLCEIRSPKNEIISPQKPVNLPTFSTDFTDQSRKFVAKISVASAKTSLAQEITDITFDSRKVQQDALFICKGQQFKAEYLAQAIAAGAAAYLAETAYDAAIPGVIVKDIRMAMALVARHFFQYPDKQLHLIGVTATKGKSTTVYLLKGILDAALAARGARPCGLLSGIEIYDGKVKRQALLTTEESVELFRDLAACVKNGLQYCVVEISSQALKYQRVAGIEFHTCSFTNIGQDHISPHEHPDFSDYFNAKLKISEQCKNFIYNCEMEYAAKVLAKAQETPAKIYSLSLAGKQNANFQVTQICAQSTGAHFCLNDDVYQISLPGIFNVENAAVAIACALLAGFTPAEIAPGLAHVNVPGRSQLFSTVDAKAHFFVDYAHNALSFAKALASLKQMFPNAQIISLFGAPAGKAYTRRKDLPQVAAQYSDAIYVLPDDASKVQAQEISLEISQHIPANFPQKIFSDRAAGIRAAFADALAKETDLSRTDAAAPHLNSEYVFFIAGKGEETFMKIDGKLLPYIGDHAVVHDLIKEYDRQFM